MSSVGRYRTDDRDYDEDVQRELIIKSHSEGWVIDTVPLGEDVNAPVLVKHCGENPLLAIFIGEAYYRLKHKDDPVNFPNRERYIDLHQEALAWRSKYPNELTTPFFVQEEPESYADFAVFDTENDASDGRETVLSILMGGNQDWFVQTTLKSFRESYGVRLSTSGGASSAVPYLCGNIAQSYMAMHLSKGYFEKIQPMSFDVLLAYVQEWRDKHPSKEFGWSSIQDKSIELED